MASTSRQSASEQFRIVTGDAIRQLRSHYICETCYSQYLFSKKCSHKLCQSCNRKGSGYQCPVCNLTLTKVNLHSGIVQNFKHKIDKMERLLEGDWVYDPSDFEDEIESEASEGKRVVDFSSGGPIIEHGNVKYRVKVCIPLKLNKQGESLLFSHCKRRKLDKLEAVLKTDVHDINQKDYAGWTPLHECVEHDFYDGARKLLEAGALPNIPGLDYVTPLHKACAKQDRKMIEILIEFGSDPTLLDLSGKRASFPLSDDDTVFTPPKEVRCPLKCVYVNPYDSVYIYDSIGKANRKRLKNYNIANQFNNNVTHIVINGSENLTSELLEYMLRGLFIYTEDWIPSFVETPYSNLIDFNFLPQTFPCFKLALMNSLLRNPPLFHNMNFYFQRVQDDCTFYDILFTRKDLVDLVVAGGGKILTREPTVSVAEDKTYFPYHTDKESDYAHCGLYIIYDYRKPPLLQYTMKELVHKSTKWLVDCILYFSVIPK